MQGKTILSDKEHLLQDPSDFIGEPQIDIIYSLVQLLQEKGYKYMYS